MITDNSHLLPLKDYSEFKQDMNLQITLMCTNTPTMTKLSKLYWFLEKMLHFFMFINAKAHEAE